MNKLNTLKELVSIKSFQTDNNLEIINYLISKLSPFAKEIIQVPNDNKNKVNLLVGINTKLSNTNAIILSGHIDTVVANEKDYNTNPYTATEIDGKLYGLGIIDMKCFFASIIDNIKSIQKLKTPIVLAISCDEETTLEGITKLTQKLKELNCKPIVTIVGEPTNCKISSSSKGCYEYTIEVEGKSCHSSMPKNGINACNILAKIITKIEKLNNKYPNTTLNTGIISGGEKVNIVPAFAKLNFDIRTTSSNYADKLCEKINKYTNKLSEKYNSKITIKNLLKIPALEKNKNWLTDKIKNKFNLDEFLFTGGCEAGYFYNLGGEAFIFGTGNLALAHKPNEYLIIEDYFSYNKILLQILSFIETQI